jgi:hypothetical protein
MGCRIDSLCHVGKFLGLQTGCDYIYTDISAFVVTYLHGRRTMYIN